MTRPIAGAGVEQQLRYGDEVIRFLVREQPERTTSRVAIHVEPDGTVLVDAPFNASAANVLTAVRKQSAWISRHVNAARARRSHVQPRQYVSGESFLYLGRRYRLKVAVDTAQPIKAALRGGYLVVTVPQRAPELVHEGLAHWYRQRAKAVFADRLRTVAAPLRWLRHEPELRLRCMSVQWGSCSPAGRVTLNPALVSAPRECIDYVLLHELTHLLHHNHSPAFYRTLTRHMPAWESVKLKLDDMAEDVFRR